MKNEREIILLNISGEDKPGLTSSLTHILGRYNATILDIGQAVIHNTLSLGILFETPKGKESGPILKDLLFKAYELDIQAKFTPVPPKDYMNWVGLQGKDRYIITLLGRMISAEQISSVTDIITEQGLNIESINRLTGRIPLNEIGAKATNTKSCIVLSVRGTPPNKETMNLRFLELASSLGIDISFQEDNLYRRNRRLVCFDMDSTLIQTEVIDELAEKAGVGERVKAITESAMRGEIDFNESFKQRMSLLKGLPESQLKEIAQNLPITEGAERLFKALRRFGFKTAILSGGFTYFGNYLKDKLGIDYVYANELEIKDGVLTGNYIGDIVNGNKKAELMKLIAQFEHLDLNQVIAVGDGANDLPMLNLAGLGIAYHAKPKVRKNASQAIDTIGLDGILYLLGFNDAFID
ncbi:phosphoserine phosphatase SerB [Halosquirtibacter xylanolyticus]|uniref:phosphoserine phosphatase SerB n=1 Tax=Halosquirtibacter xylanolyticus TaxID=3374599 RepID=UPI00374A6533|nr:phosphoserine phosphatase SerB [Prolixibacteraceae bacterium]